MRNTLLTLTLAAMAGCEINYNDDSGNDDDTLPPTTVTPETDSGEETTEPGTSTSATDSSADDTSSTTTSSSSDDTTTDEPPPACEGDGTKVDHEACGSGCDDRCIPDLECRPNYPGGSLAECTKQCNTAEDCTSQVCSGGYCVVLCDADGMCPAGTYCYPPTMADGTPIIDEFHPDRHCMPQTPG